MPTWAVILLAWCVLACLVGIVVGRILDEQRRR